ncbi:MAG: cyclic pyranopterin monophosphate synthase MoaC [Nitrospina sp.]|nr:cyclic pyranopterin monophosphate synthase MoaC [Nitrospina sp.]
MENPLTHFNEQGRARMVDVSEKSVTERVATATGSISMKPATLDLIQRGEIKKGDVLAVAQVAGIMGAKKTPEVIPMCHPLNLTGVDISFEVQSDPDPDTDLCAIHIQATVKISGKTGVEMEALTAVSVAALTIYDMCKAADREMVISDVGLAFKAGGKSGTFERSQKAGA